MFKPNQTCRIELSSGQSDVYGQPLPSRFVTERCAVVKLNVVNTKTSVRADSSASRGNAMEAQTDAILLLTAATEAGIDDIIDINGVRLRIIGVFARHDINGALDHYRIECSMWSRT